MSGTSSRTDTSRLAPLVHSHQVQELSGVAPLPHTHPYADVNHTHEAAQHTHDYAATVHSHQAGDAATLDGIDSTGFALAGHVHPAPAVTSHIEALAANATTSNTAAQPTNLSFPIAAGELWVTDFYLTVQKATTNTGMKLAVGAPAGATVEGQALGGLATANSAPVQSRITAINALGATYATGIGVPVAVQLHVRVNNPTNAGNVTLMFATVVTNVATVFAGSYMKANRVVAV